ncbi:hypothetical protein UA08_03833 [Talaromyces atroroseus]|uniref:Protein IBD2 n=1 Tax=Talaromyces atroroseus TaxID=1441469 RepID=A0A225AZ84_TALAT|nr:hypothetical protein UA08_03833 [Talaromyces atroroseus]OKL61029.1 hypothetical protein UA08_03833 [Talaromyces atroroseus]
MPSPIYPDRLIRPLPKRPLRSRLSPEVVKSIRFPPAPRVSRLFFRSYSDYSESHDNKVHLQQQHSVDTYNHDGHDHSPDRDHRHPYENGVSEVESGDEDGSVVVRRSGGFRGSSLPPATPFPNGQTQPADLETSQTKSSPAGLDGYDAFENTNNKKKRKIPTSGTLGSHHSTLTTDLASMGISGSNPGSPGGLGDGGTGTYYGSGSPAASNAGSGISGSGRGRYGRHTPRTSGSRGALPVHPQGALLGARPPGSPRDPAPPSHIGTGEIGATKPDQGIISAAIANAAALTPPSRGPNTILSPLERQASTPQPNATGTQFTFTCESDSSKSIALHAPGTYPRFPIAPNPRDFATQGTQTSPSMGAMGGQQQLPQPPAGGAPGANPGQRPKRSRDSIYALAARRRKIQQHYTNIHNPPSPEEIWMCEFCEYEAIFGEPPRALIRQYEIKDRKERRRLAEKRRLLEKAKMKGRKGKKATKNAAKQTGTGAQQAQAAAAAHQHGAEHAPPMNAHHPDDYLGEYEDETPPMPTSVPPVPQPMADRPPVGMPNTGNSPPIEGSAQIKGGIGDGGMDRPS